MGILRMLNLANQKRFQAFHGMVSADRKLEVHEIKVYQSRARNETVLAFLANASKQKMLHCFSKLILHRGYWNLCMYRRKRGLTKLSSSLDSKTAACFRYLVQNWNILMSRGLLQNSQAGFSLDKVTNLFKLRQNAHKSMAYSSIKQRYLKAKLALPTLLHQLRFLILSKQGSAFQRLKKQQFSSELAYQTLQNRHCSGLHLLARTVAHISGQNKHTGFRTLHHTPLLTDGISRLATLTRTHNRLRRAAAVLSVLTRAVQRQRHTVFGRLQLVACVCAAVPGVVETREVRLRMRAACATMRVAGLTDARVAFATLVRWERRCKRDQAVAKAIASIFVRGVKKRLHAGLGVLWKASQFRKNRDHVPVRMCSALRSKILGSIRRLVNFSKMHKGVEFISKVEKILQKRAYQYLSTALKRIHAISVTRTQHVLICLVRLNYAILGKCRSVFRILRGDQIVKRNQIIYQSQQQGCGMFGRALVSNCLHKKGAAFSEIRYFGSSRLQKIGQFKIFESLLRNLVQGRLTKALNFLMVPKKCMVEFGSQTMMLFKSSSQLVRIEKVSEDHRPKLVCVQNTQTEFAYGGERTEGANYLTKPRKDHTKTIRVFPNSVQLLDTIEIKRVFPILSVVKNSASLSIQPRCTSYTDTQTWTDLSPALDEQSLSTVILAEPLKLLTIHQLTPLSIHQELRTPATQTTETQTDLVADTPADPISTLPVACNLKPQTPSLSARLLLQHLSHLLNSKTTTKDLKSEAFGAIKQRLVALKVLSVQSDLLMLRASCENSIWTLQHARALNQQTEGREFEQRRKVWKEMGFWRRIERMMEVMREILCFSVIRTCASKNPSIGATN